MNSSTQLPWMKINDFLLDIGSERDPNRLCIATMNKISSLIPYNTGVLYLLQDEGKEYEHALVEVEPYWSEAYMNYYFRSRTAENFRLIMRISEKLTGMIS